MIRFRCVRCQHPLKIDVEAVGKKLHCPVCYFELTVPTESTIKPADPSQLYATDDKPVDVREMRHRREFASLRCNVCSTIIAVRKEDAGEETVCPDCGTTMIVPSEIAAQVDAAMNVTLDKIVFGSDADALTNTYTIRGGNSGPSENWTGLFPVYCKLCHTLMYASEEQVGKEMTCPDCYTQTVVPPKPQKTSPLPSASPHFEGKTTFGVAKDYPASTELPVPVVCELCGTRMYAPKSQLGEFKTCPDCGRKTVIKAVPKEELVRPDVFSGGSYSLNTTILPPPRPVFRTLTDYRYVDGSLDKEYRNDKPPEEQNVRPTSRRRQSVEDNEPTAQVDGDGIRRQAKQKKKASKEDRRPVTVRRSLPKRPLTAGLLTPLLTWRVLVRVLFFSVLPCAAFFIVYSMPGFLISLSVPVAGLFLLVWASLQTHFCWNVCQFSTDGNDDFDEGMEFSFIGSLGVGFWMICCSILAAVPGQFIASCLPGELFVERFTPGDLAINPTVAIRDYILLRLSHWIVFPFFFLSCMEAGSYFSPVSWRIFRAFARYTGVWGRFYGLAALLILVPEFVFVGLFFLASPRFQDGSVLTGSSYLIGFLGLNFFSLLFFRLLGRFAWVIEENIRQEQDEEDEEEW